MESLHIREETPGWRQENPLDSERMKERFSRAQQSGRRAVFGESEEDVWLRQSDDVEGQVNTQTSENGCDYDSDDDDTLLTCIV